MSDNTIIALTLLVLVMTIMALTVLKHGVDASIKLWGAMGSLTGVAFGAIISHYFTQQVAESRLQAAKAEGQVQAAELRNATQTQLSAMQAKLQTEQQTAARLATEFATVRAAIAQQASATDAPVAFSVPQTIALDARRRSELEQSFVRGESVIRELKLEDRLDREQLPPR